MTSEHSETLSALRASSLGMFFSSLLRVFEDGEGGECPPKALLTVRSFRRQFFPAEAIARVLPSVCTPLCLFLSIKARFADT